MRIPSKDLKTMFDAIRKITDLEEYVRLHKLIVDFEADKTGLTLDGLKALIMGEVRA